MSKLNKFLLEDTILNMSLTLGVIIGGGFLLYGWYCILEFMLTPLIENN